MTTVVACDQLSRSMAGRSVVSDVSFRVPAGAAFGLLGPNGSGKTTTVRLLTSLLTPSSGSIQLFGEPLDITTADRLRQRIGVQTDTNLYDLLTVKDNLTIWADLYGIPRERQTARITEVLEAFNLQDRLSSSVGTLSKGMRQKLAIARAILHEPDLLFLDEPTAGLDPEASDDLIAYLQTMIGHARTTVVICTHQLFGLERLCTYVGLLDRGRLLRSGKVDDLLNETWPTTRVRIELVSHRERAEAILRTHDLPFASESDAFLVDVSSLAAIPDVVRVLVMGGVEITAVVPVTPTIHDLYFATITPGRAK